MEIFILYIIIPIFLICILLAIFNSLLPIWFCHKMDWHLKPKKQNFDGCSFNGKCPRCSKKVMQDSQGNWF